MNEPLFIYFAGHFLYITKPAEFKRDWASFYSPSLSPTNSTHPCRVGAFILLRNVPFICSIVLGASAVAKRLLRVSTVASHPGGSDESVRCFHGFHGYNAVIVSDNKTVLNDIKSSLIEAGWDPEPRIHTFGL